MASIISVTTAIALGASQEVVENGLWGESAILTAIAIGGVFFVANSWKHVFYTLSSAFFATVIEGAVETLMKPLGIPSLNFSYHIITWSWVLAGNHIPGLFPIEVQKISVAEEHIKKVKLIEKVTVKFSQLREISRLLNIRLLKERMAFELSMTPVLLCWYASIGDI